MDQRSKATRKSIQIAFLKSIKEKKYMDISVAEICRKAGIGRSTFYLHYHKIDDVLNEVLDDAFQNIGDIFSQFDMPAQACNRAFCCFIRNSGEYQPLFLDEGLSDYIIGKLSRLFIEDYVESICKHTRWTAAEAKQIFWFQMHGCFSVARHNVYCSEEKWSNIKCTIDQFLQYGLWGK